MSDQTLTYLSLREIFPGFKTKQGFVILSLILCVHVWYEFVKMCVRICVCMCVCVFV